MNQPDPGYESLVRRGCFARICLILAFDSWAVSSVMSLFGVTGWLSVVPAAIGLVFVCIFVVLIFPILRDVRKQVRQ
jgi:hypothetical protein